MAEKCPDCGRYTFASGGPYPPEGCIDPGSVTGLRAQLRASEAEVARLKSELADVHALDAWAVSGFARHWRSGPAVGGERHQCQAIDALNKLMCLEFAETPELARRAAVEWLKTRE